MNSNLRFVVFFGIIAASLALPIGETEHESREGRQFFNGANAAAHAASFSNGGFGGGFSGANAAAQASSFGGGFGGGFSGANAAASANSFGGGFIG